MGKKTNKKNIEESEVIDITVKEAEIAQDIPEHMFYVGDVYSLF